MLVLFYFTLGFAGACALCAYGLGGFLPGAAAAALVYLPLRYRDRKQGRTSVLSLLLLGLAAGFLRFSLFEAVVLRPLDTFDGYPTVCTVTLNRVSDSPKEPSLGKVFLEGRGYNCRIWLREPEHHRTGDSLEGVFELHKQNERTLRNQDVPLLAFQKGEVRKLPGEDGLRTLPFRLRERAETLIDWCIPRDASPFARALFLGDTEKLDFGTRWDLRISGIRHMVAVSGLHVSVLCMLLSVLVLRNRWLTLLLGVPVLVLFGAVTGFSPSVTRACIMMGLLLLSRVVNRKYDPMTELSAAVLFMLTVNPMTVTSVSFQLSCASVLGIFRYYRRLQGWLLMHFRTGEGLRKKLVYGACSSWAVSLSSLVFVTPLGMLYFGSISLIAPVTNFLTVFLVGPVFWGILLLLPLAAMSLEAASFLGWVLALGIRWILGVAHVMAQLPLAALFTRSVPALVLVAAVYGLGWLFLSHGRQQTLYFLTGSLACLAMTMITVKLLPTPGPVTVFDVGQGQCILLQTEGRNFLVDCGGDDGEQTATDVAETLLSQGVRRLDGLILTHFDRDHVCGAAPLLTVLEADRIYVPAGEALPPDLRLQAVRGREDLHFENSFLTVFGAEKPKNPNEASLCVLLDTEEYDILITGDRSEAGERELLSRYRIPHVDCLVAGHHGAADSTCQALLDTVRPETVVISAGRGNRYGHPAGETLERLRKFGCRILRTDLDGTITPGR